MRKVKLTKDETKEKLDDKEKEEIFESIIDIDFSLGKMELDIKERREKKVKLHTFNLKFLENKRENYKELFQKKKIDINN